MPPPYLLAIETSGREATAALAIADSQVENPVVDRQAIAEGVRTAQALLPAIDQLLRRHEVGAIQLAAVAVSVGPGSFTGLRIGITAAKTLAFATGAQLVAVSTLDLLAWQARSAAAGPIWAVLDAQRGDVFAGRYDHSDLARLGEGDRTQLLAGDAWLQSLADGDLVVGPVAARYADRLPSGVALADANLCTPQAVAVAEIGCGLLAEGQTCDPFQLVPRYHRLSAAEEKARR